MKRKHGSSGGEGRGGGGRRGGGRGGRRGGGGGGGGGRGGRRGGSGGGRGGRRGGGRGGGGGDRSKRGRNHIDYEPQPEVKPAQATENNVASEEEEDEDGENGEPTSAYTTLLQTLQATNESFAKAYAPRRKEEQGASESSEDDEDYEELGSELEGEDGSELGDELDGGIPEEDGQESVGVEDDDEENGDAEADSSSESEWEEVADGEEVEMGEAEEEDGDQDSDSERLSSGAGAGTSEDPFKKHMELDIADTKIAELVDGKVKFKTEMKVAGLPKGTWLTNTSTFPKVEKELKNCALKERLLKHWQGQIKHKQFGDFRTEGQAQFFSFCNNYEDIMLTLRCGIQGTVASNEEHETYVDAYVLHVLNHVLKTRDLVTKNNEKLQRQQTALNENGKRGADFIDPPRDQGFTRPKVLMLLPMRSTALKLVKKLIELAPKAQTVDIEHKARFFDDFGAEDDEEDQVLIEEGQEGSNEYTGGKPADFKALFSGNNDDHFRIGIKFTRKSIKLYSDFYSSDIIVASPLGLITQIGEAESSKKDNSKDVDFLSSIEIVVMDYTDVILMQNWMHVLTLFDHLNRIPQSQHGTDFMRIREWCLNGHSRHYRQTMILSAFPDAKINALFHRSCVNHAGKVKLRMEYPGILSKVMLKIRQVYERIDCKAISEVDDARFEYFTKQVFPRIKGSHQGGILLFASSFDFVRLRNFLKSQECSFCLLNEYTKQSDISRSRSWFFHRKRDIMLYTERAHFYHRYKIRGIRELIFYSLPDHAQFYCEISNLLEGFSSCTVLFSKLDKIQLERIVGSTYAERMLKSKQSIFTFM
ncbi:protein NUCLEOLAR FACTOR 1 [Physcomitrium patens]|uniref:U3 small nucleolar RNA-associated protein 25 n=1 Tax=Physcomitrium patens TaxID=3218 RepID=A0A2K1JZG0_PHYPA|nr:U3 small nucleolar RNA-associated protein 25-like [Physcomitrium patens]PNR46911.1 hypothetical protein PHYPA_014031 [Physcomitrium patens]|eukprot:XP_024386757.1 U3 small nucleolar RNA-associated protein 25-like [Physcomitrella patens]